MSWHGFGGGLGRRARLMERNFGYRIKPTRRTIFGQWKRRGKTAFSKETKSTIRKDGVAEYGGGIRAGYVCLYVCFYNLHWWGVSWGGFFLSFPMWLALSHYRCWHCDRAVIFFIFILRTRFLLFGFLDRVGVNGIYIKKGGGVMAMGTLLLFSHLNSI